MALFRIIFGAVLISFSGIWVSLSGVAPEVSAFYRVFFGALLLFMASLFAGELRRPRLVTIGLATVTALMFAVDLWCWHSSISFIGPGLSTILANMQVFILAGVSIIFFRVPVSTPLLIAPPLAFGGLALIVWPEWQTIGASFQKGVYMGLAAAFFYALYLLSLRRLQRLYGGSSLFYPLMLVSAISSILLGVLALLRNTSLAIPTSHSLGALVALAFLSQVVGWVLITTSLPRVVPAVAGLALLLQPALAFVWDVVIFQRPTTPLNWFGVALTIMAIYGGMAASNRKPRVSTITE
jgi:drug/metabolite transporter (DMT)-like permease